MLIKIFENVHLFLSSFVSRLYVNLVNLEFTLKI